MSSSARLQARTCECGRPVVRDGRCDQCAQPSRDLSGVLQRRTTARGGQPAIPEMVHGVLASPGRSLDDGTRSSMESAFGHDFSQVRVHTDARAAVSASAVNAAAYTVGRDVVFGANTYRPHSAAGRRLLAHELAHVVQQVRPGGAAVSNQVAAERDADQAASRNARGLTVEVSTVASGGIQRQEASAVLPENEDMFALARRLTSHRGLSSTQRPRGAPSFSVVPSPVKSFPPDQQWAVDALAGKPPTRAPTGTRQPAGEGDHSLWSTFRPGGRVFEALDDVANPRPGGHTFEALDSFVNPKNPWGKGIMDNMDKRGAALLNTRAALETLYAKEGADGVATAMVAGVGALVKDTGDAAVEIAAELAHWQGDKSREKIGSRAVDVILNVADLVTIVDGAGGAAKGLGGGAKAATSSIKSGAVTLSRGAGLLQPVLVLAGEGIKGGEASLAAAATPGKLAAPGLKAVATPPAVVGAAGKGNASAGGPAGPPPPRTKLLSLGNPRKSGAQWMLRNVDAGEVAASQSGHQVYEYYTREGECLYVGKGGGAAGQKPTTWVDRGWDHIHNNPAIAEADRIVVRANLTEQEAFALEQDRIGQLDPRLNRSPGEFDPRSQQGAVNYAANVQSASTKPTYTFFTDIIPPIK